MTAEEMAREYGGVKFSIWHYWKAKLADRISYGRLNEYHKRHGHHGFLREMIWHLLLRWLRKFLYEARKNGKLDTFEILEQKPKNGRKRK
jgi:hypothetical protein